MTITLAGRAHPFLDSSKIAMAVAAGMSSAQSTHTACSQHIGHAG